MKTNMWDSSRTIISVGMGIMSTLTTIINIWDSLKTICMKGRDRSFIVMGLSLKGGLIKG